MKFTRSLFVVAALAAAAPAFAGPLSTFTLDFEGVNSFGSVNEFYNGGTDAAGNTGVDHGVSFSPSTLGLSNDVLGPYFSNAPSAGTVIFASDADATVNVARGFVNQISFYYSNQGAAADAVRVYSGLNGAGDLLASISLVDIAQSNGCTDSAFCNWQMASLEFNGTARSLNIGGNAGAVAFDNLTLTAVPEPSSYALVVAGLLALGGVARRRPR